jgi:uncharacterized protein (DUF433 family)
MSSSPTLEARPVPLDRLPNGVLRVAGTRIGLDLVIGAYKAGQTPEQIVEAYDSLRLADVYALIAYYLDHTEQVEEHLREEDKLAEELCRKIEASQPPRTVTREVLLERKARMEEARRNAEAGR